MSIGVVLLSYKEEENLKFLIPDIKEEMRKVDEDYQIYVIDSMTPLDNTKQLCEKHGVIYINQKYPGSAVLSELQLNPLIQINF